jgi:hypothetical protein
MVTRRRRSSVGLLIAGFAVLAAAGCASAPAAKNVTDIYGIAGRWIGTCNLGSGLQPCDINVTQDGAFNANSGAVNLFGRATVASGRASFDVGTAGGDIVVYETSACQRQMEVKGSRGTATGQLTQDGAAARRVSSISEVAGRWSGNCDFGPGGLLPCTVTITPDGVFTGNAGTNTAIGKVTVVNGRAVFDTGSAAGDIVLHDGAGCKRQIAVVGAKGVARGLLVAQ